MQIHTEMLYLTITRTALLTLICSLSSSNGGLFENITDVRLYKAGDLLIGLMYSAQQALVQNIQTTFAFIYGINKAVAASQMPGNISIGYILNMDCCSDNIDLTQALRFQPRQDNHSWRENEDFFSVVGVLGPLSSPSCVKSNDLFSVYKIPQISPWCAVSVLSHPRHKYFLWTFGPSQYQINALAEMVKNFRWTYISVIYRDDNYGKDLLEALWYHLADFACFAIEYRLPRP